MNTIPDLFAMEIDLFIRANIESALEAAGGDLQLAAGLKQSPQRFIAEAKRLGLVPSDGPSFVMPQPQPQPEPEKEHAEEATASEAKEPVRARNKSGRSATKRTKATGRNKPGRPPGRKSAPLGVQPLQLPDASGSARLRGGSTPTEDEAFPEATLGSEEDE